MFILAYIIFMKPNNNNSNNNTTNINLSSSIFDLNINNVKYWLEFFNLIHTDIVLNQIILETGHLSSNLAINHNNILGIKVNNKYYTFSHWIECIIFYKHKIQNRYKPNENYYLFLQRIKYYEDKNYIYKLKSLKHEK